jgi:hypothetical protein
MKNNMVMWEQLYTKKSAVIVIIVFKNIINIIWLNFHMLFREYLYQHDDRLCFQKTLLRIYNNKNN